MKFFNMQFNSNLVMCVGIATTLLVGVCTFLDYKRTTHPDYKNRILKKREKNEHPLKLPKSREVIQRFFLQEVFLGESLLDSGDIEQAIGHFTKAVNLCREPAELLKAMKSTLPANVFNLLMKNIQVNYNNHV